MLSLSLDFSNLKNFISEKNLDPILSNIQLCHDDLEKGQGSVSGFLGWKTFSVQPTIPRSVGDDRFLGWSRSLLDLLNLKSKKISTNFFELGGESISSARDSARKLITKFPELDALVCASDTLALGAQLEYRGLKKILPISGFDNSPTSKVFNFTSLDQNIPEIAAHALVVLMGESGNTVAKVNNSKKPEQANLIFKPKLISRI